MKQCEKCVKLKEGNMIIFYFKWIEMGSIGTQIPANKLQWRWTSLTISENGESWAQRCPIGKTLCQPKRDLDISSIEQKLSFSLMTEILHMTGNRLFFWTFWRLSHADTHPYCVGTATSPPCCILCSWPWFLLLFSPAATSASSWLELLEHLQLSGVPASRKAHKL